MVQFNLLPDIKLQYLRIQKIKHLVVVGSVLVSACALVIFGLLVAYVDFAQAIQLNNLNTNIASSSKQLSNNPDLSSILTIQNQIQTLPSLESQNPVASRVYQDLLQVTPNNAQISSFTITFTPATSTNTAADSIDIEGSADSAATVNEFTDTLKFTNYEVSSQASPVPAFSNVVLSSFGTNQTGGVDFTIDCNFDSSIFSAANQNVKLVVPPGKITTRSVVNQPSTLFQKSSPLAGSNSNGGH